MPESTKQIGQTLKETRTQKGLSQRALSRKTKIPQNHISKIENGEVDLRTSTLLEISRALNLELMLVPISLVPTFRALLSGEWKGGVKQIPMYKLDLEEGENG